MIVSLDELKRVLGIDLDNVDEDENLTRLILASSEWVEGQTHRRFDTPIFRTEYHVGTGQRTLYLEGHIDDSPAADNISDTTLDPSTSLRVFRRAVVWGSSDWEELIEGEDWERRKDHLIFLRAWYVWPYEDELKIEYLDGYAVAPEDVKQLVIELAMNQYLIDSTSASGTAGVTSEKIGDYSYTVDLGAVAVGSGTISSVGRMTLSHRTRKLI